jgi:hypothetical protein
VCILFKLKGCEGTPYASCVYYVRTYTLSTTRVVFRNIYMIWNQEAGLMYRSNIPFYHRSSIYLYNTPTTQLTTHQQTKIPKVPL